MIVNLYDVPTLPNLPDLAGPSSNIIDISDDSDNDTNVSSDEEETDDSVSRNYFFCKAQKNTAVSFVYLKLHTNLSQGLYLNVVVVTHVCLRLLYFDTAVLTLVLLNPYYICDPHLTSHISSP